MVSVANKIANLNYGSIVAKHRVVTWSVSYFC